MSVTHTICLLPLLSAVLIDTCCSAATIPALPTNLTQACIRWLEFHQHSNTSSTTTTGSSNHQNNNNPNNNNPNNNNVLAHKFLHLLLRILVTLKDQQIVFRAAAVKALAAVIESDASVLSIVCFSLSLSHAHWFGQCRQFVGRC
jgi:hypothetical protein